jgi:hypothetical protein
MVRESRTQPAPPPKQEPYPAEKARGGEIILDIPTSGGFSSRTSPTRWRWRWS